MNRSDTEHNSASGSVASHAANTRLTGPWLIIARVAWLALVFPSLGLFVVSLPVYYQQLQRACVDPVTCSLNGSLTAQELQELSSSGFSVSGYAALYTIFFAIIAALWCGVGFLIFWRRSDDWLALLAAFFLVLFSITPSVNILPYVLALAYPAIALPLSLMSFLGEVSLGVFFLFFPNGRLAPRWMGLILLLITIKVYFNTFPSPVSLFDANWLYVLISGVLYVALIFSQIFRYRRESTPVQRQQTKWIVLGISAVVGFYMYDIDLLINRTLVYGTLTVLLALVYVGLILGLQYLLRGIISQNNDVAIVVSTLAIAALFQPLRYRIQAIIDRRFYRRKYDAAKIVDALSATLRNEVDLSQLREHLLNVVLETMQPAHISLWLRPPEPSTKQKSWLQARPEEEECVEP